MKPAVDVKAAVAALRKGGVIACPTEAVWGLSCDPDNDEALAASWPGPHTWLVPDNGRSHGLVRGAHQSVALRVTDHPLMKALCEAFGGPLVSTSANRAGDPPAMSAEEVATIFGEDVAAIVAGELGGNAKPSTIRDLVTGKVMRD